MNLETMAWQLVGRVLEGGFRAEQHRLGNFGAAVQREFLARLGFERVFRLSAGPRSGNRHVFVAAEGHRLFAVFGTRAMAAAVLAAEGAVGAHAAEVMALATLIHESGRVAFASEPLATG